MFTEREKECVWECAVFVLHVSELCASSAGLIVVVQRLPVRQSDRNSLILAAGWETWVYSICVGKARAQCYETHGAAQYMHKRVVKNRCPTQSSLRLFGCGVGKDRRGEGSGCRSLIKIVWVWGRSPLCFLCLCLHFCSKPPQCLTCGNTHGLIHYLRAVHTTDPGLPLLNHQSRIYVLSTVNRLHIWCFCPKCLTICLC